MGGGVREGGIGTKGQAYKYKINGSAIYMVSPRPPTEHSSSSFHIFLLSYRNSSHLAQVEGGEVAELAEPCGHVPHERAAAHR